MFNPAAFILLLAIAYNPLHFPQGMQLWGPLAKNSLRKGTIQLLLGSSLFSITQRLTQPPHITTTSKQRHAPKKHIRKKHILIANAFKHAGGGGGAGHPKAASKVEPSVAQSSVPYLINVGTGISSTQPHQLLNFRMFEHLIRLQRIVFDRGRGTRWVARRNRISGSGNSLDLYRWLVELHTRSCLWIDNAKNDAIKDGHSPLQHWGGMTVM
jgi:hypothetical protein